MRLPAKFPLLNFLLLLLFASAWFGSEVLDYNERERHRAEVDQFMKAGGRFTHEDGDALRERIKKLEVINELRE